MEQVDDGLNDSGNWPARKRLRTSHACDGCRTRKTRCDGGHPCATCAAANQECAYGSEANSRSKTDVILESVLRVERSLHELKSNISSISPQVTSQPQSQASPQDRRTNSFCGSTPDASLRRRSFAIHTPTSQDYRENGNNFENAVLDSMHTSTTESVLQWPHFDVFPQLRSDGMSIFHLEQSRAPLAVTSNPIYPYVDADAIDSILDSFEHNVNFWYPTMSQSQLQAIRSTMENGVPAEDTVHCCLCLLTLALGCASQSVAGLRFATDSEDGEKEKRLRKRKMGDVYFQLALKKIHVAHLQVDSETTQCLFFAAIYFASLVRPLQAWEYLSATATRCMLLLSYPSDKPDVENEERIRRIFWSCYILESDYMAELSACPPSGIARVESSVQLPSVYHTHTSDKEEEESSLYFLACISMRRLLNRVHQLLYARDSGAAFDQSRFPRIVAELQRQLDDWRDVLPASFYFSIDTEETATEAGGFLRQRYLTCRGVIYRPYLMWMLSDSHVGANDSGLAIPEALVNSKACLDACLLHALNLRGFSQTVMIDTWICSLSMSGAMLILLAACQVPALKDLISHRVTRVGDHLQQLFHHWRSISFGADSPSVERSLGLIEKADGYIKESC
ncbi:Zn(2)-C6 fungal-type domain-containing protein [Fusarium sp. Ph1]|nr:Zn(2)-C6 fungal-type domain-containing protein [Fusarium sp. Ph1]